MSASRICVVCMDRSNHLKQRNYSFAKELADAGHSVAVLSIHEQELDKGLHKKWNSYFADQGILWSPLGYRGVAISSLPAGVRSYQLLQWMQEHDSQFDKVYFSLRGGLPYFTLLAKHQGLAFQNTTFEIDADSSTLYSKEIAHEVVDSLDDLAADFLEKESVGLADSIVCKNSAFMSWMECRGWRTSRDHRQMNVQETPFVTVCLTHFNRPHYLAQALDSLRAQDYANFEVVLVDDASTLPEAISYLESLKQEFASKGWQIIRNERNVFPGAARNIAARVARGEYLLFMDDDNYAKPNEISTFVQAAKTSGAPILTCAMDVFCGESAPSSATIPVHRFLPLGAAVELGIHLNLFGDINALIKRDAFQAIGGLTEDKGVGAEDWEFFARSVLKGYRLETIPLALFWYRDTAHSITKTTHMYANRLRAIRPYLNMVPQELQNHLSLAQAQQIKLQALLLENESIKSLFKRAWRIFYRRVHKTILHPKRAAQKMIHLILAKKKRDL